MFPVEIMIEILSAICEPFLTATTVERETIPLRAIKATVSDLCACQPIHREQITPAVYGIIMTGGNQMNKFYMNGKLIHKASDHNTKRCEVEKWVFLPHSDFDRLKANPYQEHEAITAARDLMYEDKNTYHCIMLLDEYGDDGLLIEAEGFDYPRLSMFVPDAKSIYERYQTSEPELKLHDMIKDTVEKIAELAHTDKTDFTSADMIDMDEVESLVKNAIVQQLAQRDDIKMAENTDIGVDFQPDIHVEAEKLAELKFYCPLKATPHNCQTSKNMI